MRTRKLGMTGKWAGMAALLATSGAVMACSYSGCDPAWTLFGGNTACHSRAVIAPGNDTRVNLYALGRGGAGLGLGGKDYPELDYDQESFGRTFLDWDLVQRSAFPKDANAEGGGEGYSRCNGIAASDPAFNAAMTANAGLLLAERSALGAARARLAQTCTGPAEGTAIIAWPNTIGSPAGKAYLAYLQAADMFYAEQWDEARTAFAGLANASDLWIAETAGYMQVRVEIKAAQAHSTDEYGYYQGQKSIDMGAAGRAKAALGAYLKAWPQGRYAASARGLERRVMWLSGDFRGLALRYDQLLGSVSASSETMIGLVQEIDNKLLFNGDNPEPRADGPLLLASIDLMKMRVGDPAQKDDETKPTLTAQDLASQQAAFMRAPELYAFLQANHAFYIGKDYSRVLALIPDDAHKPAYSPLAFSGQVLRGQALAALDDRNEAGFWRDLLGGASALWQRATVELALAMNLERHGKIAEVFAANSPINDRTIREILMAHSAGPELLRSAALDSARPQHERDAALFTLLYKQLSRGRYGGFASNLALVRPDATTSGSMSFENGAPVVLGVFSRGRTKDAGFACPALLTTVQALNAEPRAIRAQLCLGEFWRLNGFDDYGDLDLARPSGELGGAITGFPGMPIARSEFYNAAMNDPRAAPADKAYALYRAVRCYAPSGNNSCGGTEATKAQRKAWFERLRREFPKSPWAQQSRVYW